jgi:hypothetical protein
MQITVNYVRINAKGIDILGSEENREMMVPDCNLPGYRCAYPPGMPIILEKSKLLHRTFWHAIKHVSVLPPLCNNVQLT